MACSPSLARPVLFPASPYGIGLPHICLAPDLLLSGPASLGKADCRLVNLAIAITEWVGPQASSLTPDVAGRTGWRVSDGNSNVRMAARCPRLRSDRACRLHHGGATAGRDAH